MNVSQLARQLRTTTEELLEKLPRLGFDIGKRAIKVDDRLATKIMDAWKREEKRNREMNKIAQIRGIIEQAKEDVMAKGGHVKIPPVVTVREFAALLNIPINQVLMELMKNGVLASMNERIDFDTAAIIGENFGFSIIPDEETKEESSAVKAQEKLESILAEKTDGSMARPPIVVVMGHVDHGKTKILDTIRKTDVISSESGGITQHIGAYQVKKQNRLITFIDTPGHEAFTAMRSRGARVADIAILVIAADDSVRPQTKEAIKIIQDAKLPFIVAINKIDKPEANLEKVKQDLASLNLLPEDWGGNVICSPVSAKTGEGIDDLLETIILLADIEKENLVADPDRQAIGTIIESHVDKGEGPVATILIQAGTLRAGDVLAMDNDYYGKVKVLKDYRNQTVTEVKPGTPAKILGLKIAPAVGSVLETSLAPESLNKDIKKYSIGQAKDFSVQTVPQDESKVKNVNLIIKADVLGSLEAILESLAKKETAEIKIKVVGKGLGLITESDIQKAEASGATIIGFHVTPSSTVANLARDKKVTIKTFEVIYHLIEDVEKEMELLKEKEIVRQLIGKLEVLKVFRHESNHMILGGRVTDGHIAASESVIVIRKGEPVSSGKVNRLESGRQVVDKVNSGTECGVTFEGKGAVAEGDILEFYQEVK